jgi:hypothetical protein
LQFGKKKKLNDKEDDGFWKGCVSPGVSPGLLILLTVSLPIRKNEATREATRTS